MWPTLPTAGSFWVIWSSLHGKEKSRGSIQMSHLGLGTAQWIFQKSEQVGRRQQGEGCREETSTAFGKRRLVFPVNRYPMNGVRMRKEDDAGKLAWLSPGPTSHQAPPPCQLHGFPLDTPIPSLPSLPSSLLSFLLCSLIM